MPRIARKAPGGWVYHVMNRANGKLRLFKKDADFLAFEEVLRMAHERTPIRILGWCLMINHWHFILWPRHDGELTQFTRWLTLTHAQRWKHAHDAVGHGHLYQGRFKSFPIQQDPHLLTALRYVERNALRAGRVERAEQWRWGSAFVRLDPTHHLHPLLSEWPMERPGNWLTLLNTPQTLVEERQLSEHIERSRPLGSTAWTIRAASSVAAEQSLRPRGRPVGWRKAKKGFKRK